MKCLKRHSVVPLYNKGLGGHVVLSQYFQISVVDKRKQSLRRTGAPLKGWVGLDKGIFLHSADTAEALPFLAYFSDRLESIVLVHKLDAEG